MVACWINRQMDDHQRGAPQVVITPILPIWVISGVIGPGGHAGIAKVISGAQTRSSQPFSMAGRPYHQVG